jgi:hypothetical protein
MARDLAPVSQGLVISMNTPNKIMLKSIVRSSANISRYAALLWMFSFLFALRVLGQAVQRWWPQPFLPPFHAFQGSTLPYWLLLSFQLVILFIMVRLAWRMRCGALVPGFRAGKVLLWTGCIYMVGSLGRIIIGATLPEAPAWFSTWIPAAFHVVLAAFVLTLGLFHQRESCRRQATL